MILSVSRRTDIPAFYSQWFFNRLREGFVLVPNPMNPKQVSRVSLSRSVLDCIVFWTKNPAPMLDKLEQLADIPYYFLFTVTPYGPDLERYLPPKTEILDTFARLSGLIGAERVVWRYDPIVLTSRMDEAFHAREFERLARFLAPYTRRCIFSFLDMYKKCERNLRGIPVNIPTGETMTRIASFIARTARENGIEPFTCAEQTDFSSVGAYHASCVDGELVSRVCGYSLDVGKDKNQRGACRCVESVDIGAYHTCPHICLYCYANSDLRTVQLNAAAHDPASPVLYGTVPPGAVIKARNVRSNRPIQKKLF